MQKNEMFAIVVGDLPYWYLTSPSIYAYAKKADVDIKILREKIDLDEETHPKFNLLTYISRWSETASDTDRLLFVDADVYIKEDAPNLFDLDKDIEPGNVWMSPAAMQKRNDQFKDFLEEYYKNKIPDSNREYRYCNSGVVLVDGKGAKMLKKWLCRPFINRVIEEMQFNAAVYLSGAQRFFPIRTHSCSLPRDPYFVHFSCGDKVNRIKKYLGIIPG